MSNRKPGSPLPEEFIGSSHRLYSQQEVLGNFPQRGEVQQPRPDFDQYPPDGPVGSILQEIIREAHESSTRTFESSGDDQITARGKHALALRKYFILRSFEIVYQGRVETVGHSQSIGQITSELRLQISETIVDDPETLLDLLDRISQAYDQELGTPNASPDSSSD